MTTSHKPTIRPTEHVRNAQKYLGGPLEETLKPYLNERGTMSDLAGAIGVQKATVNYWIMRLGIRYARVAYDEDEVVRVYSKEDADVADAAIESGLVADDLQQLDRAAMAEYSEFKASGSGHAALKDLTDEDLELLDLVKKMRSRLTDEDIDLLNSVKSRSFRRADFEGFRDERSQGFTLEVMQDCQRLEDAGLSLRELAGMPLADLKRLASMATEDVRMLEALRDAGWESAEKMEDDLELLETVRKAGWDDATTAQEELRLLQTAKDVGLDDPEKERAMRVFSGSS